MIVNICCSGSSGSTFFAQKLGLHPQVACGRELCLFSKPLLYDDYPFFRRHAGWFRRHGLSSRPFYYNYSLFRDIESYGIAADEVWGWAVAAENFRVLTGRFHDHILQRSGRQIWAEKTPENVLVIGKFLAAFPESKVIHLVRDPRDVILSLMGRGISLEHAAMTWLISVAAIQPFRARQNVLELRYEDLVTQFADAMQRVCSFLELNHDPDYFSRSDSQPAAGFGAMGSFESWHARPDEGPSSRSIGKYATSSVDFSAVMAMRLTEKFAAMLGVRPFSVAELLAAYDYPAARTVARAGRQRIVKYPDTRSWKRRVADLYWERNPEIDKVMV